MAGAAFDDAGDLPRRGVEVTQCNSHQVRLVRSPCFQSARYGRPHKQQRHGLRAVRTIATAQPRSHTPRVSTVPKACIRWSGLWREKLEGLRQWLQ